MQTVGVRPGPVRWTLYAWGARLPARHREWVLHDVTAPSWVLRHLARATVQLAPFSVLIYVFLPGEPWVRALAVLGGLMIGYFYSFAYMAESAEHRAVKAGYPRGTAARTRADRTAAGRQDAQERYERRWRS